MDLVNEDNIVMKRGVPVKEMEEESHPVHKYWKSYVMARKGLGEPIFHTHVKTIAELGGGELGKAEYEKRYTPSQ